ncbi:hypothetical protein E4Q23_02005 [Candidatus Accumulibacter phosphatis]|uniref:DUF6760 domain-containing protein n=1 Tax=Candidatus Accumulibacter phosphatis TaxID=327160 RepID=A0ABX1TQX7_9PROT|nr:hypothetical protein [Candidatus Accumulibacter phosphatis]
MRPSVRRRGGAGGITGYPLGALYEEVAFLAYHLHWSYAEIFELEHRDRHRWCNEVSAINKKLNEQYERR